MLVFATKIPVNSDVDEKKFIDLCAEWVYNSPHYHNIEIKYDIATHSNYEVSKDNIKCEITCFKDELDEPTSIVAFRLHNNDNGTLWIIELLFIQKNGERFISVQNNCDSKRFDPRVPKSHKPNFIKLLMEKGYGKVDDFFPVCDKALSCNTANAKNYAAYINGEILHSLPMVYISKDFDSYTVDYETLARWLSGMAYVVFEDSKETSYIMKDLTQSKNAHNGYIGIYYPETNKHQVYSYSDFPSGKFETNIVFILQQSLVNHMSINEYNWTQIQLLKSRAKLSKAEGKSQELDEFINLADNTERELKEKIEYLQRTNDALTAQLESLKNKNKESTVCLTTDLTDFYVDEQHDFVIYVMNEVAEHLHGLNPSKIRQHEILQSIINNNQPTGENERIISELKRIFKVGMKWNATTKSKIKDLGFQIIEGDHKKIIFKDSRYMYTVSSTPSDHRSPKNLLSEIERGISISKKLL